MEDVQLECYQVKMTDNASLPVLMTNSSGFIQHIIIDKEEWTGQVIEVVLIPMDTNIFHSDSTTSANKDCSVRAVQSDNVQSEKTSDVFIQKQLLYQHLFKDRDSSLSYIQTKFSFG